MLTAKELTKLYAEAKREGRICSRCKWMITVKNWNKGDRLCYGCIDALRGVNTPARFGKWRDEPIDKTGEMI